MPKSHRKKTRRGGGWFDDLKSKASGLTSGMSSSSWTSSMSSLNPFAKKETPSTSYIPSTSTPYTPPESSSPTTYTSPTTQTMGGKRRRSVKRGGSYTSNMSQTNLAATASPVSGIQTVKAQTWVGGKTKRRRRRHKHTKSRRYR